MRSSRKKIKKPGRPSDEYPLEEMDKVLSLYDKERSNKGIIKYMDVFRYSKDLFNNGIISYKFTEYFWRKADGRKAIDKMNQVYLSTLTLSNNSDNQIVNTQEAVDRFFGGKEKDKENLINLLSINESKLMSFIKHNQKLQDKLTETEGLLKQQKDKAEEWKLRAEKYEKILFMWLEASVNDEVPLINLITTGKTRHPIIDYMFTSVFSDNPTIGYEKFEDFRRERKKHSVNDNVVSINVNKQKSILDDINF